MTTLDTFKFIVDSTTAKAQKLETREEIHELWNNILGILSCFTFHEGEYYFERKELEDIVEIVRLRANSHLT